MFSLLLRGKIYDYYNTLPNVLFDRGLIQGKRKLEDFIKHSDRTKISDDFYIYISYQGNRITWLDMVNKVYNLFGKICYFDDLSEVPEYCWIELSFPIRYGIPLTPLQFRDVSNFFEEKEPNFIGG